MDIDIETCMNCKYFGERTQMDKPKKYCICTYYLKTGKHRMDDFPAKRKPNEWLFKCNKFEEYNKEESINENKNSLWL